MWVWVWVGGDAIVTVLSVCVSGRTARRHVPGLHPRERHGVRRRARPRRDPGAHGIAVAPVHRPHSTTHCCPVMSHAWTGHVCPLPGLSYPILSASGTGNQRPAAWLKLVHAHSVPPIATLWLWPLRVINPATAPRTWWQCNNGSVIVPATASPVVVCHVDGHWSDNGTTRCVLGNEAPAPAPPGEQVTCCVKFDQFVDEVWSDGNRIRVQRVSTAWYGLAEP